MSYSKLHASVVNSSLWGQPDPVRILFITLLAICDKDGVVYGSRSGLQRIAFINPDEADDAWETLLSPDPDSSDKLRAPENEGRRIKEVPGGFHLLNFGYYRGLRNDDDRREQNRAAQERFKRKALATSACDKPDNATVSHGKPDKATVSRTKPISEAETKAVQTPRAEEESSVRLSTRPKPVASECEAVYAEYPLKVGKPVALRAIAKAIAAGTSAQELLALTRAYREARAGNTDFVPHPATWFNQRRFLDDPATWKPRQDHSQPPPVDRNAGTYNADQVDIYSQIQSKGPEGIVWRTGPPDNRTP